MSFLCRCHKSYRVYHRFNKTFTTPSLIRWRSSTSAIKAGLRAESGGNEGRFRDRQRNGVGRDRFGGREQRTAQYDRRSPRTSRHLSVDSGYDRLQAASTRPSRDRPSKAAARPNRDRPSQVGARTNHDRPRSAVDRARHDRQPSARSNYDGPRSDAARSSQDRRTSYTDQRNARQSRHDDSAEETPFKARPPRTQNQSSRHDREDRPSSRHDSEDRPSSRRDREDRASRQAARDDDKIPIAVPYTTASSQFLYGVNGVTAALKARRRTLHKLYVLQQQSGDEARRLSKVIERATVAGVRIQRMQDTRLLDRLSEGRPHNGAVLEASPIPSPPVLALGEPDNNSRTTALVLAPQSAEDERVNGATRTLTQRSHKRHPFIVFVDGITDPGNLGNIIRSAHFYGIDAVAVATGTCAPLTSPIMAKASSGACEAVPLLSIPKPSGFIHASRQAGWTICAAVAPRKGRKRGERWASTAELARSSPLAEEPCVLMLGAEGEGLRENLRNKADMFVSIERGAQDVEAMVDVGVDSVNVAVAAGVLMEAFVREVKAVTGENRTAEASDSESGKSGTEEHGSAEASDLGF